MTPITTVALRPAAVITEIIELLQASPVAGADTLVHWGLLAELPTKRERVYLLGTSEYVLEPNDRGHHVRREDFALRGMIEVHQPGDVGSEACGTRAWELLSGVDEVLREERTLAAGARYSGVLVVTADQVAPAIGGDGWVATIIFSLGIESVR